MRCGSILANLIVVHQLNFFYTQCLRIRRSRCSRFREDPRQRNINRANRSSAAVTRQTDLIRTARGSKRFFGPEGRYFHLDEVFDVLTFPRHGGMKQEPGAAGVVLRALRR